ncbi:hypothetical protein AUEXF2481DRAFT_571007 [Aureobasidium subglaciale EXF-2481]|uniref:Uncharacterized protein n=1 Tax=Aureobasidium subglaciale (strain EXF-2481) TaxID=1043005 RepID=A0A074YU61_AURSE|nr:uncharacterized protein AUEXF2481DRAFT_571007 [Aureobasidium subglaciale EXF-2481]KEQ90391.1 hypothetical protein AUEXF2481DRAFT_571007 [Aureobasidium subglaciale EXF-2481]
MCTLLMHNYTCGCKREGQYIQSAERHGSNVKCDSINKEQMPPSLHMCIQHMIKPGKAEMHRPVERTG